LTGIGAPPAEHATVVGEAAGMAGSDAKCDGGRLTRCIVGARGVAAAQSDRGEK
jgi:hypothetical protein